MPRSAPALACLALLPAVVVLGLPAYAEEPAGLSATEFLARVEKSHPGLPLLEAAVEQASAHVATTGLWANPAVSYDREELIVAGRGQPENFWRLELPLEVSGRRGLRVEGARLGLEAAREDSRRDRAGLLLDAMGFYWRAAAARQTVELLRQEREALARLIGAVRSRAAAGDTSGYDLDRLEVEVELLADQLADAEREHDAWGRRLGLLLGAPGARFDATQALQLPSLPGRPEAAFPQVLAARADYQAAQMRVAQAERELSAAGRGWVPEVVLTGGVRNAIVSSETAWGYTAGLALGLPVFDHGQGDAARAHALLRQARAAQQLLERQVESELLTAREGLTSTLAQAANFERTQLTRVDRLVERAELSYQEGERPVFDLLDAYRTARAVRLRQVDLMQRARLAELALKRAMGLMPGETR